MIEDRTPCCSTPSRRTTTLDNREIQYCRTCGDLSFTPVDSVVPDLEEYDAYLRAVFAKRKQAESNRWTFNVEVDGYEELTKLKARMTLILEDRPKGALGVGDDVELTSDSGTVRGWIEDLDDDRLTAFIPPMDVPPTPGRRYELTKAAFSQLAGRHIGFLETIREEHDTFQPIHDPAHLPSLLDDPPPVAQGLDGKFPDYLNDRQRQAMDAALRVPEGGACAIQGPPGTGKTTVVGHLVRLLALQDADVLVTSHTHVAIDNVLEKVTSFDESLDARIARAGRGVKISSEVEPYHVDSDDLSTSVSQSRYHALHEQFSVVGMTIDSLLPEIERNDLDIPQFDWVFVDEASMNLFHKTAAAYAAGERLVLVGDHFQLPPIVPIDRFAKQDAFSQSTFETVAESRPDLLFRLDTQYRSVPGVMEWSNRSLYNGQLRCHRTDSPPSVHLTDGTVDGPIVWVDTGTLEDNEHKARYPPGGDTASYGNPHHIVTCLRITGMLLNQGYEPEDIGYISPFRLQTFAFRSMLAKRADTGVARRIESSTVDAFQGREKEVIIFDLTATEPLRSHESINRLNVSLTRAQDLLIIVGPRDFASNPKENPLYWSLGQWDRPTTLPAPTLDLEEVDEADFLLRTGKQKRKTRDTSLEKLMSHVDFRRKHYSELRDAFQKRAKPNQCKQKLWSIVDDIDTGFDVVQLYEEVADLDELPPHQWVDLKRAVREVKKALSDPEEGVPAYLRLRPKRKQLEKELEDSDPPKNLRVASKRTLKRLDAEIASSRENRLG